MILAFFLFSGKNQEFKISDLFDVKQGRQNIAGQSTQLELNPSNVKVLTMKSINFSSASINPSLLLDYTSSSDIAPGSYLTASCYILNRVGKNRGMSLLNVDFDFEENKIIAGNDFIFLRPRSIILDNLPMFHAILDVALFDDTLKKSNDDEKSKLNYITVKELQDKKISIPSENFSEMAQRFMEIYEDYIQKLKNFNLSKKRLEEFKNKFLRK